MLSLQRLFQALSISKKNIIKTVAILSIASLVVANVVPELSSSLPSLADNGVSAQSPQRVSGKHIWVSSDGNDNPTLLTGCDILNNPTFTNPGPIPELGCNLAQAITKANADTTSSPITIIFSNTVPVIHLTADLPPISRASGAGILIDGEQSTLSSATPTSPSNNKTILEDVSNPTHTGLHYFFRLQTPVGTAENNVTISNFAFTKLRGTRAAAITTDNPATTGVIESAHIGLLAIENNYFGTADGTTLLADRVRRGVDIAFSGPSDHPSLQPQLVINDNDFYNVSSPIRVQSAGASDSTATTNCELDVDASIIIQDNKIGVDRIGGIDSASLNHGGWSDAAIEICHLSKVLIENNRIANSLGEKSIDSAIHSVNSGNIINNNTIGIASAGTPNPTEAIYGYGIYIHGTYNQKSGAYIAQNTIGGIKLLNDCLEESLTNAGDSCGGTGILLENTTGSFIYSNFIGGDGVENDGYGVDLEGSIEYDQDQQPIFAPSAENVIFHNFITGNKADGIHIGTIKNHTSSPALDLNNRCLTVDINETLNTNNCLNRVLQNAIFDNGNFNGTSSTINDTAVTSPEGGIGIDLRSDTDVVEQKYGQSTIVAGGTTNDSDISTNDPSDSDTGANGVINTPVLYGSGSTATGSSIYQIHGHLPDSGNGKYWIEVYSVACPTPTPTVEGVAHTTCSTDSPSVGAQSTQNTYGQGQIFLCGTFVEKTSTTNSDNWSCNPSDFSRSFAGGLITATATSIVVSDPTITYSEFNTGIAAFYAAFTDVIQPVGFQISCKLATQFVTNIPSCPTGNETTMADLGGNEFFIASILQNTSEFSKNVFIPLPTANINKAVRSCTGTTASTCSANAFASEVNATPGQTVEFRIDLANTTGGSISPRIEDQLPTVLIPFGLTFVPTTCQVFILPVATAFATRPATGSTSCAGQTTNQTLSYNNNSSVTPGDIASVTILGSGERVVIYVLATVNTNAAAAAYTNNVQAIIDTLCPETGDHQCRASAIVNVNLAPSATVHKVILNPHVNGTDATETLTAPTANTQIDYRTTLTLHGVTRDSILANGLEDVFPHTVGGNAVSYLNNNCTYSMTINSGAASTPVDCDNKSLINTSTGRLVLWSGSHLPASVTTANTVVVTVNYSASVPPLAAGTTSNATLTSDAKWNNSAHGTVAALNSTTVVTITPPAAQGNFALTKTVSPTQITSSTTAQTVNYTVTLTKPAGVVVPAFVWSDTYPAPLTNYSNCQVAVTQPTGITVPGLTCATPLNSADLVRSTSIPANVTQIRVTYSATLPPTSVTTAQQIVNQSEFAADIESKPVVNASATLTIAPVGTPTGTAVPSITKKLDNNLVVGTDRHLEKIFKPGDLLSYTVTLRNTGNSAAANASLRDTLSGNINTIAVDSTPTGTTGTVSGQVVNVPNVTIPSGGAGVAVRYHGSIVSKTDFNLDDFNLNESSNPARDDDFYIPKDTDPDGDMTSTSNSHRRLKDITGTPDGRFVSLGKDGSIIVDLGDKVVVNSSGNDFSVLELDQSAIDDNDKTTESYDVSVSQDGETFKAITADNTDTESFDLKKANLTWARYIKLEDSSSSVKAQAPGADIDAVCLLHIGVQVPNSAELTYNGQTYRASENAVVDVTNVFKKKPSTNNCEEPEPTVVTPPPAPLSPPPAPPAPPAPVVVPPKPPSLPKTGPEAVGVIGLVATVVTFIIRRRKAR